MRDLQYERAQAEAKGAEVRETDRYLRQWRMEPINQKTWRKASRYSVKICEGCSRYKRLRRGQKQCKRCLSIKAKVVLGTGPSEANLLRRIELIPEAFVYQDDIDPPVIRVRHRTALQAIISLYRHWDHEVGAWWDRFGALSLVLGWCVVATWMLWR